MSCRSKCSSSDSASVWTPDYVVRPATFKQSKSLHETLHYLAVTFTLFSFINSSQASTAGLLTPSWSAYSRILLPLAPSAQAFSICRRHYLPDRSPHSCLCASNPHPSYELTPSIPTPCHDFHDQANQCPPVTECYMEALKRGWKHCGKLTISIFLIFCWLTNMLEKLLEVEPWTNTTLRKTPYLVYNYLAHTHPREGILLTHSVSVSSVVKTGRHKEITLWCCKAQVSWSWYTELKLCSQVQFPQKQHIRQRIQGYYRGEQRRDDSICSMFFTVPHQVIINKSHNSKKRHASTWTEITCKTHALPRTG